MRSWPAILFAAFLSGCIVLPADPDYAGPVERSDELMATFAYDPVDPVAATVELLQENDRYVLQRAKLPEVVGPAGTRTITIDLYAPPADEPVPVILVLPILGGDNEIANHFARHFARSGLAAAVVHRQESYKDTDELDAMNRVFRQIVIDHRHALDWVATRPRVDGERIGLFGISAGGVQGALVCAAEPRVGAAVLALTGGDLAHILTRSSEPGIVKMRRRIMEDQQVSRRALHDAIRDGFEHDPLRYAPHIDARRVLMILAAFDRCVPYNDGMKLRKAMGCPQTNILPTGHYTSIVYLPWLQHAAVEHFRRHMGAPAEHR